MKRIPKTHPPRELEGWLRGQAGHNCSYADMPGGVKRALLQKLLQEQGGLCGYTGIRITESSAHIEHVYPQTRCREEEGRRDLHGARRDVDYENVIAAFPLDDEAWRDRFPFGAKTRGSWWDETLFVHPLRPDCETQFRYTLDGAIEPADGDSNGAAATTIRKLNLDDRHEDESGKLRAGPLTAMRRRAIEEFLLPLSEPELRRIQERICSRDREGRYAEFCFVLDQACAELLRRIERARIRRAAVLREQRRGEHGR